MQSTVYLPMSLTAQIACKRSCFQLGTWMFPVQIAKIENIVGKYRQFELKVNKFQNENMKSSHCLKYERKNLKNSAQSVQGRNFQIFRSYFGQREDSIFSFWNFLTFNYTTYYLFVQISAPQFYSLFYHVVFLLKSLSNLRSKSL